MAHAPSITGSTGGGGGGGGNAATEIGELSLLEDMTAGSKTTTGSFTIYAADGTTAKATGQITTTGSITSAWAVEWDTSYGIRVTGVTKNTGSGGTVTVAINPAASVFASANWSKDDVVAQVVYGASVSAGTGAIYYGAAPYGSITLGVNDARSIKATVTGGTVAWTTERWGNYDNDPIVSLGSSAIPASAVYLQEGRDLQNRIKLGASDYIAPADWYDTAWDGRGIGQMLVTVSDDPATSRYTAAGGYALILSASNNDASNPSSSELRKAKFYARNEAPETAGTSSWSSVLDWSAASESFAAGESTYTIGGLSVTLDYESGSGPASIDLASGVLSVQADDADYAYLIVDLGEDFANVPLWACVAITSVTGVGSTTPVIWQLADDTTQLTAAGHWQELIGQGGSETTILGRFATGAASFVNANNRTVSDITTTATRLAVYIDGTDFRPSFDQGTSALPADGGDLSTVGPNSYSTTTGAYTTTNAKNQRYLHLRVRCNATIRMSAAKRS